MSSQLEILVAEDELVTRRLIEKFLTGDGHRVHAFENGTDAWRFYQTTPVQVVVSDWMMPDSDGLDLCRNLLRSCRGSGDEADGEGAPGDRNIETCAVQNRHPRRQLQIDPG